MPHSTEATNLNGVVIQHEDARRALKMGRDAFYAAMRSGDIPCRKIGGRWFVLGEPFRKMVGLSEASTTSIAA